MEITREQFALVEHCLPKQRGNVSMTNLQVVNAMLYVAEQGCKWRGFPHRFGNWHTIYTRMRRWAKKGVLLTAPLIAGRSTTSSDLLSPGEYKRLARHLREIQRQPADLVSLNRPGF